MNVLRRALRTVRTLLLGEVAIVLASAGFSTVTLFPERSRSWAIWGSICLLLVGLVLTVRAAVRKIRQDMAVAKKVVPLEHVLHGDLEIRQWLSRELLRVRESKLPRELRDLVLDACLVAGPMRGYNPDTHILPLDMTSGVFSSWSFVFGNPLADQPLALPRTTAMEAGATIHYVFAHRSDRVDLTLVVVFASDLAPRDPALNLVSRSFRSALDNPDLQAAFSRRNGVSCIDLDRQIELATAE